MFWTLIIIKFISLIRVIIRKTFIITITLYCISRSDSSAHLFSPGLGDEGTVFFCNWTQQVEEVVEEEVVEEKEVVVEEVVVDVVVEEVAVGEVVVKVMGKKVVVEEVDGEEVVVEAVVGEEVVFWRRMAHVDKVVGEELVVKEVMD